MFAPLAEALVARGFNRFDVFNFHPLQLASYLETLWELRRRFPPPKLSGDGEERAIPDPGLGTMGRDRLTTLLDSGIISLNAPKGDLGGNVFADILRDVINSAFGAPASEGVSPPTYWHHLIYAYLIENTRA